MLRAESQASPARPEPRTLSARVAMARGFPLDLELEAPAGFTIVSGPSGAGKSTLLGAIAGFVRPTRGRVALGDDPWFDSQRGIDVAPERRRVAMVFQSLALFPHMTAAQNVAYGTPRSLDRASRRALAARLLERLHVAHVAERRPVTFSGGEAQRVALARALATTPAVVLLDEPFSALDAPLRRALMADLRDLLLELDVPVLLVTHQPEEAGAPGDRTIVLERGRIVATGSL